MEPDAGLVQNIAHAHQPRAYLRCQTDSLGLAAGQRSCCPGQGKIFQSHIHQKAHSRIDFLQNLLSDKHLLTGKLHIIKETVKLPDRKGSDFKNIFITDGNRKRFLFQTHPVTFLTGRNSHVGLILLLDNIGACLSVLPLHVFNQPLKGHRIDALSSLTLIVNLHLPAFRSVNQHMKDLFRQILYRRIQTELIFFGKSLQKSVGKAAGVPRGLPAHHLNRPLAKTQRPVGNHELRVKFHLVAQSEAHGAGSKGVVKGKAPRLDFTDADSAVRAGKALAEIDGLSVNHIHHKQPLRQRKRAFHGICKPSLNSRLCHKPVNHNFDIVLDIFIQLDFLCQLVKIPVNAHTDISALSGAVQNLHMLAFPPPYHRGKQLDSGALRQLHNLVHHLVHALLFDFLPAVRAMRNSDSGIQKPEIIINFRNRPHCGTGIPVGGFLVDGNRRGQSRNRFHIGLFHLSEKLPCIGGKGLHISSLPFRVERVKSQRGLA